MEECWVELSRDYFTLNLSQLGRFQARYVSYLLTYKVMLEILSLYLLTLSILIDAIILIFPLRDCFAWSHCSTSPSPRLVHWRWEIRSEMLLRQLLWVSSSHLKATTGGISCLSLWLCGIRAPIRNSLSAWKPPLCHKDTAKGKECPFGCLELCLYGSKTSDLILDLEWTFLSSSPDPSSLTVSQNDINFSHCYKQQG